jgi:hypothetical protein
MEQQHHPEEGHEKVHVTVEYTGTEPFSASFPKSTTFHHIELEAMRAFGLEAAAADKYALQFHGADLDDRRPIGSLGQKDVHIQLTLKHEPVKG